MVSLARLKLAQQCLFVGLVSCCSVNFAAEPIIDFAAAFNLAKESDPELQAARSTYLATLESTQQSKGELLPQLSLSAEAIKNQQKISNTSSTFFTPGTSDFTTNGYTLSLSQTLYNQGSFIGLKQAKSSVAQSKAQLQAAQQDLIIRLAERYFNLLRAYDNSSFVTAEKKAISRQLIQTKQRFEVGLIAKTDVFESQAAHDLVTAEIISARNNVAISKEHLWEITGKFSAELAKLKEKTPLLIPEPNNIEQWSQSSATNNHSLLAAQYDVEIARASVDQLKAGHFPSFDLVASHRVTDTSGGTFGGRTSTDNSIGIQFSVPLYSGGVISSKARQASHQLSASKAQLEKVRRSILSQTRKAYLGVVANISRVKALNQAVKSSLSALEASEAGLNAGTRTTVDVLNTRRELFRTQRNYASARYDYILSTLVLKQAAGQLNQDDVNNINLWFYQPP